MNLQFFFTPSDQQHDLPENALGQSIQHLQQEEFDITQMHLAIVGINSRGDADMIRAKLFALKRGTGTYKIADLGNLQAGLDGEETHGRVQEVCEFLLEQGVVPLLIGGNHDLALAQYKAYEDSQKLISVINVDAFLDMEPEGNANSTYLNDLLMHQPNFLFSYNHLAHQSYLIDPKGLAALDKLYFESLRLGELRYDIKEAEPLIRLADMMTFDISAIRSSDAPGNPRAQPFGLSGEEACQICWYAGMNDKMTAVGFHEYYPSMDDDVLKTASVMATMIWYFIDGFYNRKDSGKFESSNYIKYSVALEGHSETLTFYKSKVSEKWWMAVTYGKQHLETAHIPCSYADYQSAINGDFPVRWIHAHGKLV